MFCQALRGAELTIKKDKPLIVFESNPGNEDMRRTIINFLKSHGYAVGQVRNFENMFIAAFDS